VNTFNHPHPGNAGYICGCVHEPETGAAMFKVEEADKAAVPISFAATK